MPLRRCRRCGQIGSIGVDRGGGVSRELSSVSTLSMVVALSALWASWRCLRFTREVRRPGNRRGPGRMVLGRWSLGC